MKNPTDILIDATKFPAAIEAKLPAGAPKISTMLADFAGKLPAVPDLPIDIPAPPVPMLPELPAPPELRRYVSGVEVRPVTPAAPRVVPGARKRGTL
ncbi:unnamed protein product [marine sediment metagenome]|uniref:Uncharacterized protein n=1 Tax=marine sediment metagenome TaxID=412755 RepID=X1H6W1_9ZZZZ